MEHLIRRLLALREILVPGRGIRAPETLDAERGDVPGWVLITLMTAALVAAIWAIAGTQLTAILERALDKVSGI